MFYLNSFFYQNSHFSSPKAPSKLSFASHLFALAAKTFRQERKQKRTYMKLFSFIACYYL